MRRRALYRGGATGSIRILEDATPMAYAADAARQRLDRALAELERKTRDLKARAAVPEDDLFAAHPAAGEPELRAAAEGALATLAVAADEIRAVLETED